MKDKDTGGPAFPCYLHPSQDTSGEMSGMTLRDWFAGLAMQARVIALGSHYHTTDERVKECHELTAKRAYERADEMLKARSEP